MYNLNPKEKQAYMGNIREISDALTRMEAEKSLISEIAKQAKEKYGIEISDTKKLGKIYYEQSLEEEREKANELFDFADDVFNNSNS